MAAFLRTLCFTAFMTVAISSTECSSDECRSLEDEIDFLQTQRGPYEPNLEDPALMNTCVQSIIDYLDAANKLEPKYKSAGDKVKNLALKATKGGCIHEVHGGHHHC